jgi:hypothetical protein
MFSMADTTPSSTPTHNTNPASRTSTAAAAPGTQSQPSTAQQPKSDTLPKVRWDDAKMKTGYANVCNVTSTREEVTLLFGVNQAWQHSPKEVVVQLTDRIILSPFAAKRLVMLMATVVKEYESRFGPLEASDQKTYDMIKQPAN